MTRQPVTDEITKAFLELMTEKSFIDITVTDIIKRAGVARASFYRNFGSTSDILDAVLDRLTKDFQENVLPVISSRDERQWRSFLFRYIYFINDNHPKLMLGRNTNIPILLDRMADAAHRLADAAPSDNIRSKYSIPSRIGAINSVLMRWIDGGRVETPEEIIDYLMCFVLTI